MPTSATGTSTSSRGGRTRERPAAGFTLIELLVVVAIIGIVTSVILLSVSLIGRDTPLQRESDRLYGLMTYAREQAELQTREYGVLFQEDGYEFLVYDGLLAKWRSVTEDEVLSARKLPAGLGVQLIVDARPVVLRRPADAHDKTPQVMIFSDGDLTSFEASLLRDAGTRSITLTQDDQGRLLERPMVEAKAR